MKTTPWIIGLATAIVAVGVGTAVKAKSTPKALPETKPKPEIYMPEQATQTIAFYETRAKADPQGALNYVMLSDAYLRRSREHGADIHDAISAEKAARASLAIRERGNEHAYMALAQSLKAQHRFAESLEAAKMAEKIAPHKRSPKRLQIDLILELGDYDKAEKVRQAYKPDPQDPGDLCLEARFAQLHGQLEIALTHLSKARALTLSHFGISAENAAWYYDHIAELHAAMGHTDEAMKEYRQGLAIFPRDHKAMLAQARLDATRGDWKAALPVAEKVAELVEAPHTSAFVGDCQKALGNDAAAEKAYRRAEEIGRESRAEGIIDDDRLSATFNADHDRNLDEALALARKEISYRKDIYAYDMLAWASYKKGLVTEADAAMTKAMSLGTKDAMLYFHAGMIAKAKGDQATANAMASKALETNPFFSPQYVPVAKAMVSAN